MTVAPAQQRTHFRPCIDLHGGLVKQIVGGTLTDDGEQLKTNFVASASPDFYAKLYKEHGLRGGHVIMLGASAENVAAARAALSAWPHGLQVGGGINAANARAWLDAGAEKVIVTSYLFPDVKFNLGRLQELSALIGKEKLVVDVSCRKQGSGRWIVATDKWQRLTDMIVSQESLDLLAQYCSEFLVHAADVEGLCEGIDAELVAALGEWSPLPCTYAGGARHSDDLSLVERLSHGRVDLTFGSALDIFGGTLVRFQDLAAREKALREA